MATLRVYANRIEQNYRYREISAGNDPVDNYSDVTNNDFKEVSQWDEGLYLYWYELEFRFPASSLLSSVTINSVTVSPYLRTSMSTPSNMLIHVSDEEHTSEATWAQVSANVAGRRNYGITSYFNAYVAEKDGVFFVRFRCLNDDACTIYCNDNPQTSQVWVDIDFTGLATPCTAPTAVEVDNETPAPNADVELSWSGAKPGDWNYITEYAIYRATSASGTYTYLKSVATTNTYGSTNVTAPAAPGSHYYYKVLTRGSEGAEYYSGLSAQYAAVTAVTSYCIAPGVISFNTLVASVPPMMTWGNAYGGLGNAITAYEIQYSESADNDSWGAWTDFKTLYTTEPGGNSLVPIAATLGYYRRYRIKTIGTLEGYDSDWSAASESVRTSSSSSAGLQAPFLIVYEYPHLVIDGEDTIEKGPYPLGIIGMYHTLILLPEYQGVGEFFLAIPFSPEANELLVCGNFDDVPHHLLGIPGRRELMIIMEKVISRDSAGVEMIALRGKYMPAILAFRAVTASIQAKAGPVEQIKSLLRNQPIFLEHFDAGSGTWVDDFNDDLNPDDYGDRRFPDFHWKEPSFTYEYDPTIVYQAEKLAGMLDSIIPLCKIEGCGIRGIADYINDTADTLTLWLQLYMGIDRSIEQDLVPPVVFSEQQGNILSVTYTHNIENKKTAGYATNGAVDILSGYDKRLVDLTSENDYSAGDQAYINDGTPTANVMGGSGMNRSELGMAISEIDEPTTGTTDEKIQALYGSCRQLGKAELINSGEEHTLAIVINPYVGPQYRRDYDVGDIVTGIVARYGITMHARITGAIETYEPGKKMQLSLTFGEAGISLLGRIKQIARRRG